MVSQHACLLLKPVVDRPASLVTFVTMSFAYNWTSLNFSYWKLSQCASEHIPEAEIVKQISYNSSKFCFQTKTFSSKLLHNELYLNHSWVSGMEAGLNTEFLKNNNTFWLVANLTTVDDKKMSRIYPIRHVNLSFNIFEKQPENSVLYISLTM